MESRSDSRSESGFSLLEALIMLMIASMVLAVILPVAMQSISSNLGMGQRSLADINRAVDESVYRGLLHSAMPARQTTHSPPGKVNLQGDAATIRMISLSPRGFGCSDAAEETPLQLVLEKGADPQGGQLVCVGPTTRRVLATWPTGTASFGYSKDGVEWSPEWPLPGDVDSFERQLATLDEPTSLPAPLVQSPLVRFELIAPQRAHLVWIERAGAFEPVAFDQNALFGAELGGAPQ